MIEPGLTTEDIVESIQEATQDCEFASFLVGFKRIPGLKYPDEEPRDHRQLKTAVGLELLRRWPHRRVEFDRPEMRLEVGPGREVRVLPAPLFIGGRYRKLSRGIPASRWMHLACDGLGCDGCDYTGNLCGPSVQETFSGPVLRATGGEKTYFHGLGREDIDARMLGLGRPFVLEVTHPRKRSIDFGRLLQETALAGQGYCDLLKPRVVDRSVVKVLKEARAEKTYRAWIVVDGELPRDSGEKLKTLAGQVVEQYSPRRVMHRRGRDSRRDRRVIDSNLIATIDGHLVWEVRAESGTYIKELISGDDLRTRPSVSELLGVRASCVALDVMEVHWRAPWEAPEPARETADEASDAP